MISSEVKVAVDELTTKKIFIIGGNKLQNELITSALEEETGFSCTVVEDLSEISHILETQESTECLVLYDCLGKEPGACIAELEQNWNDEHLMLGLFNLSKGQGLEKDAFARGVRAFFYRGEPFNIFLKGIVGIFKGEYWISRRLLTEWVAQQSPSLQPTPRQLSDAEKKMLALPANGASNKEVADGRLSFPLIGEIQAAGRSVVQVKTEMEQKISRYVPDPVLTIGLHEIRSMLIYVIGRVNQPGRFPVYSNVDVLQALAMAGGCNTFADSKNISCHLFTCVVAMTYLRMIELKLTAAGINRSAEDVMDDMRHLHSVLLLRAGARKPDRRLEIPTKTQAEVLFTCAPPHARWCPRLRLQLLAERPRDISRVGPSSQRSCRF